MNFKFIKQYIVLINIFFLFVVQSAAQVKFPTGAKLYCVDTPFVRQGRILEWSTNELIFLPKGSLSRAESVVIKANEIKKFTLLKNGTHYESWAISGQEKIWAEIIQESPGLRLGRSVGQSPRLLLQQDSSQVFELDKGNFKRILEESPSSVIAKTNALPYVHFQKTSIERYIRYHAKGVPFEFAYPKLGMGLGYSRESINLDASMGSSFQVAAVASKALFYVELGMQVPVWHTLRWSFSPSILLTNQDQTYEGSLSREGIRPALTVNTRFIEIPLLVNYQTKPLFQGKKWYSHLQAGVVFRRSVKSDIRAYQIRPLGNNATETIVDPITIDGTKNLGLALGFTYRASMAQHHWIAFHLRYNRYFNQNFNQSLYLNGLRIGFTYSIGK